MPKKKKEDIVPTSKYDFTKLNLQIYDNLYISLGTHWLYATLPINY